MRASMKTILTWMVTIMAIVCVAAEDKPAKPEAEEKEKPKSFAEVIKEAEAVPGLFTLYRKEDTLLLEILPEQLDRPFLCSPTLESGLGERSLLSAQML